MASGALTGPASNDGGGDDDPAASLVRALDLARAGDRLGFEGALDRSLARRTAVHAEWTRTVAELCADGVSGTAYAHETYRVRAGTAGDFLSLVRDEAIDAYGRHGWELVGALRTALHDDAECIVIWAIPTWEQWAAFESDVHYSGGLKAWRERTYEWTTGFERFLMMDAPLSPMKIGRQPSRDDRTGWTD